MRVELPVRQGYNLWANTYDQEANFLISMDQRHKDKRVRAISLTRNRRRALDVCCGTGRHLPTLERHFDSVVGIDLSDAMLAKAAEKRSHASTLLLHRDFLSCGMAGFFDFINCSLAMMHFSDLDQFIDQLSNSLAPGGILYLTDATERLLSSGSTPNFDHRGSNYQVSFQVYPEQRIRQLLESHGFTILNWEKASTDSPLLQEHPKYRRYIGHESLLCITARKDSAL